MKLTVGTRVHRKGDPLTRGTVARAYTTRGKESALVRWDRGMVTDTYARDLRATRAKRGDATP